MKQILYGLGMLIGLVPLAGCAGSLSPQPTDRTQVVSPTGESTPSSPPAFLRQSDGDLVLSVGSTIRGILALSSDGCLYLQASNERWLIVWPPETSMANDSGSLTFRDSFGAVISVGDEIELGGTGSQSPRTTTIAGETIPPSCRAMNVFLTNKLGVRKV